MLAAKALSANLPESDALDFPEEDSPVCLLKHTASSSILRFAITAFDFCSYQKWLWPRAWADRRNTTSRVLRGTIQRKKHQKAQTPFYFGRGKSTNVDPQCSAEHFFPQNEMKWLCGSSNYSENSSWNSFSIFLVSTSQQGADITATRSLHRIIVAHSFLHPGIRFGLTCLANLYTSKPSSVCTLVVLLCTRFALVGKSERKCTSLRIIIGSIVFVISTTLLRV